MDDCLEWASQVASNTSVSLQNYKPSSSSLFMAAAAATGATKDSDSNCFAVEGQDILGSIQEKDNDPLIISQSQSQSHQHLFQQHFIGGLIMEQSSANHGLLNSSSWKLGEQILNNKFELAADNHDQDQILNTTDDHHKHHLVISGSGGQLINEAVIGHHGYGINGRGGGSCSRSMESLECLLSGTNSNTDTSNIEDDGINSMIFSHENCKSLWNTDSSINNNAKESTNQTRFSDTITTTTTTVEDAGFHLISENPPKPKRARSISLEKRRPSSSNINFQLQPSPLSSTISVSSTSGGEPDSEAIAQMKEMIYRAAAFRPVNFGTEEMVEKPKRKNVRISSDPQTVAARQRRERISERIRVLQRLVPGGSKMDTASMLDEAANYLKFLRSQVKALEAMGGHQQKRGHDQITAPTNLPLTFNHSLFPMQSCFPLQYPNSSSCINYQPKI